MAAALRGARGVGFTIVSISISLVAEFIPIFFMPGVIGLLFHEFAVVVALSVLVSAVVSLTLVPMLGEPALKHQPREGGMAGDHEEHHPEPGTAIGRVFERGYRAVHAGYMRSLELDARASFLHADAGRVDVRDHGLVVHRDSQRLLPGRTWPDPDHNRGG